ncbi:MAG: 2-dehydropantoate 2-reductase N-terminal domain-containing protein [Bacteroidota bacterium]|nr:2-dehydropantoate 2-reductase N-terminal domain-containing protein [Bacteroidota bacterium]
MTDNLHIVFVGAGAIGTSMGNILAGKESLDVTLLSIESDVVESINSAHFNHKYFPGVPLYKALKATTDNNILRTADIVFLAIPSVVTVSFVLKNQGLLKPETILVNLAKGFADEGMTIAESLMKNVDFPVCSMKGPTFARELMNNIPTSFTLATVNEKLYPYFNGIFEDTCIFIDYSSDVRGVELLSILKNIYAIVMGIVDAQFNSPNLRFLVFTRAFSEIKNIMMKFGGDKDTIFNYCGIGDFSLTSLNDLSRNRTLGLLIGKGFFTPNISDKVVLEGKIATGVFYEELQRMNIPEEEYPIIAELNKVFRDNYDVSAFVSRLLKVFHP